MPEETTTPQPSISGSNNIVKYILFAALGLLLLGGSAFAGYWYGIESSKFKTQSSKPQLKTQSQATPTPTTTPTPSVEDETTDWKVLTSPKGYQIKYPTQFFLEERAEGFYVLLENPQNPMGVAFYVDDRGVKTLSERREQKKTDLTDPIFSDLGLTGVAGFIVEGTMGPGHGQGEYVKTAYIDLSGRELIFGCEGLFCKSDIFDQILSTFKFLE